jgi:hypothetical protein
MNDDEKTAAHAQELSAAADVLMDPERDDVPGYRFVLAVQDQPDAEPPPCDCGDEDCGQGQRVGIMCNGMSPVAVLKLMRSAWFSICEQMQVSPLTAMGLFMQVMMMAGDLLDDVAEGEGEDGAHKVGQYL